MAHRPRIVPLALAFLTIATAGASPSSAIADEGNSLVRGATAVQFFVLSSGSRAPFRTTGVYLKHQLTARSAIRIGADYGVDNASGDAGPGSVGLVIERDRHYAFTAIGEFVRYLDGEGPVTMFVGIGPYWSRNRSFQEYSDTYPPTYGGTLSTYRKFEERGWEVGGSVAAGFEWFFRQKLSVLARLGMSAGVGKSHREDLYRSFDGTTTTIEDLSRFDGKEFSSGSSGAAVGFAAYF